MLDNSGGAGGGGGGSGAALLEAAAEVMVGAENGGGAGEGGGGGGEEEERGKGEGGNRWPREETLALLKIRADMDLAFRDSTVKAPLWDEVSRKLGELGYHRSARKCKEKFENIYKYHKRTKECRSGRQNGKNYRFFEQLERFDNQPSLPSPPLSQIQTHVAETTKTTTIAAPTIIKVTSGSLDSMVPHPSENPNMEFVTPSTSTTSSSGRESEGSVKKKRKLSDYFEKLMKEILEKQENLQNQLLAALEKCERDRIAREEAWRLQQMDRIRKEQEYLANERAISAARDATVMAFLQKISEQAIPGQFAEAATPISEKHPDKQQVQTPGPFTPGTIENQELGTSIGRQEDMFDVDKRGNGFGESSIQATTSRWPKAEVEALVRLRTNLGMQFQDNGLKGPLWEEISSAMKKLGYDRSAKRCKEKWENINKYYKRVRESHKRRPESSKTCPYFHLLESIYEKKSKGVEQNSEWSGNNLEPEHILMQMMGQQEQQPQQHQQLTEDGGSENADENREDDAMEEEEENDNGDGYELVANHPSSVASME
nr:trihelix transcription factor GT-2-like [Coffea arabica]